MAKITLASMIDGTDDADPQGDAAAVTPTATVAVIPSPSVPWAALAAAHAADSIPAPHSPVGHGQLNPAEESDLATCEAALDNLRIAFWAAGKALQVIRDARLYRAEYPNFDAYCEGRWQMRRSYADKLIRAWPLAEVLSPIGLKKLNEGQVRELLPLARDHGEEAAVVVYEAVFQATAEVDGIQVTAEVLKGAVAALPASRFDKDETVSQIREYVARLASGAADSDDDLSDEERWKSGAARERDDFRKSLSRRIRTGANPSAIHGFIAELRAILDEAERRAAP